MFRLVYLGVLSALLFCLMCVCACLLCLLYVLLCLLSCLACWFVVFFLLPCVCVCPFFFFVCAVFAMFAMPRHVINVLFFCRWLLLFWICEKDIGVCIFCWCFVKLIWGLFIFLFQFLAASLLLVNFVMFSLKRVRTMFFLFLFYVGGLDRLEFDCFMRSGNANKRNSRSRRGSEARPLRERPLICRPSSHRRGENMAKPWTRGGLGVPVQVFSTSFQPSWKPLAPR